jgi:mycothiol synthase
MTIESSTTRATGAGVVAVHGYRLEDGPTIRAAMLAALDRGELDGMEAYQLEHAIERLDADPGSCAVAVVDGQVAGWVVPADDDLSVVKAFRRRGVGRQLVAAGRALAGQAGLDRLRLWIPRRPDAEGFARACGLRYASSLWQMRLPGEVVSTLAEPVFPADTRVRTFQPGVDEAPFVALVNRVFLDHPSPIELSVDEVRRVHALRSFDPTTVLVVEDAATDAMIGFCRIHPFTAADGSAAGEIRLLGVDRAWRGRGLGRGVTTWGVAELRRRGARSVQLAVEGQNEGALRLYNDLGFRFGVEWPHWTIAATSDR